MNFHVGADGGLGEGRGGGEEENGTVRVWGLWEQLEPSLNP